MSDSSIQGLNLSEIGLHSPVMSEKNKTDKDEFLQLFVAQLKHQNPLEPQDGSEFLGQLAQFSTVEGIKNMEGTFNKMADTLTSTQALQATSLVGKKVHVKAEAGIYSQGSNMTGAIDLPQSVSDLTLEIRNETGQVVKTYQINSAQKGDLSFVWDGLDDNGNAVASGVYQFVAKATVDGQPKNFETYISSNVDSVTINKNGQPITLNVNGFGKVSIDDIKTIS